MERAKVCREHSAVKTNGYCRRCKSLSEKARYDANPQKQRDRKRKEYAHKKLTRKLEAINGEFSMATSCEHDGALAVPESEMKVSYDDMVYNCPSCGEFFTTDGTFIPDPTEGEPAAVKTFPQTQVSAVGPEEGSLDAQPTTRKGSVQTGQKHDGNGAVLLGATAKPVGPKIKNETMREDVSPVPAERPGKELVSGATPPPNKATASKGKTKAFPAGAVAPIVLDGPWSGAPCPNLSLGCAGVLEPFHTLQSEQFGNDYFYRCGEDGVTVVLSFKRVAEASRRQ